MFLLNLSNLKFNNSESNINLIKIQDMKKITVHPNIFLIENFLSDEECQKYLSIFQHKEFEEAKISSLVKLFNANFNFTHAKNKT